MVLVDTNILLHAINSDSPGCERASFALEGLINSLENWALSWGILYEFLRVATHPRVFPNPWNLDSAYAYVKDWVSDENCTVIGESHDHNEVLSASMDDVGRLSGNILHDFHHAVLMREHGISEILTLDKDFRVFPWIRIRPLTQE